MNHFRSKIEKLKAKDKLECFLLQSAYIEAILSKYFRFSLQLELNDKPNFIKALDSYISNVNGILKFSKDAKLFEPPELVTDIDNYYKKRNSIIHNILETEDNFEDTLSKEIDKGDKILERLSYVENVLDKVKTKENSGFISGNTIQKLNDLEKEVFVKYHIDSKTLENISKDYGITRERVRQILNRAEKKMKGVTLNYKTNSSVKMQRSGLTDSIIIDSICESYNVSKTELLSKSRKAYLVLPRQIIMYLLRNKLDMSFPKIVKALDRTDHTTAIHACEKIGSLVEKKIIIFR